VTSMVWIRREGSWRATAGVYDPNADEVGAVGIVTSANVGIEDRGSRRAVDLGGQRPPQN